MKVCGCTGCVTVCVCVYVCMYVFLILFISCSITGSNTICLITNIMLTNSYTDHYTLATLIITQ
jgi:hypothetical protein